MTKTILEAPYYIYRTIYPKTLLQLLRPLYHGPPLPVIPGTAPTPLPESAFGLGILATAVCLGVSIWDLPKQRGTLFWGPYHKDPTI